MKQKMNIHQLKIKKGKELSLHRNHPWVFSGAITFLPENIEDGDLVEVLSYNQTFLGIGHYQGGGSIAVRILSFSKKTIDITFWQEKISNAFHYRRSLGLLDDDTNTYRLIHGEGDGIPGLIIDIYKNIAVIQCHSIGIYRAAGQISEALIASLGESLDTVYLRCKDTLPEQYSQNISDMFLKGYQESTIVKENNIHFKINVVTGQKTGFFLDQRENRDLVSRYAEGKTVLNCFCYTGGFSLYALVAGATEVVSVDISQKAVDLMDENIGINKFNGKHISHCANVMTYLNNEDIPQYDIVIVDPPAFAKSLHKRHNAVQAYKRLNALAFKKVKSGGFLFTFSCSQVVGTQLFYDTIVAAGIETGKNIRVVKSLSQGPDHPINLFHPEGHYLKGLLLYVE
jgi:23S rRNA (cytosine1962-C5)-methyltransferase